MFLRRFCGRRGIALSPSLGHMGDYLGSWATDEFKSGKETALRQGLAKLTAGQQFTLEDGFRCGST